MFYACQFLQWHRVCLQISKVTHTLVSTLFLYGAADASRDVVSINSGEWVTVVGRGQACPSPSSNSDTYKIIGDWRV